ncbi:MAG: LemA family protein [Rhizomicrobium sp.]
MSERYPDLKSNENFMALQSQLEGTENRITVARKDYIDAVQTYNTTLRTIPSRWIAAIFYPDAKVKRDLHDHREGTGSAEGVVLNVSTPLARRLLCAGGHRLARLADAQPRIRSASIPGSYRPRGR